MATPRLLKHISTPDDEQQKRRTQPCKRGCDSGAAAIRQVLETQAESAPRFRLSDAAFHPPNIWPPLLLSPRIRMAAPTTNLASRRKHQVAEHGHATATHHMHSWLQSWLVEVIALVSCSSQTVALNRRRLVVKSDTGNVFAAAAGREQSSERKSSSTDIDACTQMLSDSALQHGDDRAHNRHQTWYSV